jgi:PAS domain S-box-containing protein
MVAEGAVRTHGTQVPLLLCTGTATHITSLNSEWERLLGWTREELMSRPFADFVHPNDRERTVAEAQRVGFAGYEVAEFENRFRARGGQWRRLRWSARADGCRWVAVAVDITGETLAVAQPDDAWTAGPTAVASPLVDGGVVTLPAAAPGAGASRGLGFVASRTGILVLCLVALLIAVQGVGSSTATPAGATGGLLPHMSGPVDGAGAVYTLGPGESHPPAMLGPRHGLVRPPH